MHPTTYDQREVPLASFGPNASYFLTEGCQVSMLFYNGEEISAALPDEVEMVRKEAGWEGLVWFLSINII